MLSTAWRKRSRGIDTGPAPQLSNSTQLRTLLTCGFAVGDTGLEPMTSAV